MLNERHLIIIILFALTGINVNAQVSSKRALYNDPNELSVHIGAGLTSIHHQDAQRNGFFNGFTANIGVGYTFYLSRNWGIYLGAGPGIYSTNKPVRFNVLTANLTDNNNYNFDLHTQANYNEAFHLTFLNIPIMLMYQAKEKKPLWKQKVQPHRGFYAMGGIKASLPLQDKYQTQISSITNAAYYPEMDNWAATQKFAGLGAFDDVIDSDGSLKMAMSFKLALEAGYKWRHNENFVVYAGIYSDFLLNNTLAESRAPIRNNIAVEHITDFTMLSFSEKINLMSVGIVVRLALSRYPQTGICPYKPKVR